MLLYKTEAMCYNHIDVDPDPNPRINFREKWIRIRPKIENYNLFFIIFFCKRYNTRYDVFSVTYVGRELRFGHCTKFIRCRLNVQLSLSGVGERQGWGVHCTYIMIRFTPRMGCTLYIYYDKVYAKDGVYTVHIL